MSTFITVCAIIAGILFFFAALYVEQFEENPIKSIIAGIIAFIILLIFITIFVAISKFFYFIWSVI